MLTVHVLTNGFASPNGIAFLFPLHVHRRRLAELGVKLRCFTRRTPEVTECDALIIESRFYAPRWTRDPGAALDELGAFAERVPAVLYFDISDSTGWLQSQVLPFVTRYYKAQLLRDREAYLRPHYGNRIYADYYHRKFGVEDGEPVTSRPVADARHLSKLRISWNAGLADYSQWGPAAMGLRQHLPLDWLLHYPRHFAPVRAHRPIPLACRFGVDYARETVAYQRRHVRDVLGRRVATDKLSRRAYLAEMRSCRAVVSPFGYGEINYRDFEAFLCGALLVKPDLLHLETWPDLFRDGETMVAHRWDFTDLEQVIDGILGDDARREALAERAQSLYRHHIGSSAGYEEFCLRFRDIVHEVSAPVRKGG